MLVDAEEHMQPALARQPPHTCTPRSQPLGAVPCDKGRTGAAAAQQLQPCRLPQPMCLGCRCWRHTCLGAWQTPQCRRRQLLARSRAGARGSG
jgi:hypothetical protein